MGATQEEERFRVAYIALGGPNAPLMNPHVQSMGAFQGIPRIHPAEWTVHPTESGGT